VVQSLTIRLTFSQSVSQSVSQSISQSVSQLARIVMHDHMMLILTDFIYSVG